MYSDGEKRIELKVLSVSNSLDKANAFALLLQELDGNRQLPVIIGSSEAQAIALKLKGLNPSRPFTHDLFVTFADSLGVELREVYIYKAIEGVYYAYLYFEKDGHIYQIDSRTSDAIALALRFDCPIYTFETLMQSESIQIKKEDIPFVPSTEVDISTLKEALNKAINEENYELASRLHDEIHRREKEDIQD